MRATTPTDVASLLALTDCPADRLWRYPLARRLTPWLVPTPVTPNQVTLAHTALALIVGGLVARGTTASFVTAGVLCEVRAVLDCLDGVLARAKQLSSPLGQSLDKAGDSIAFVAIVLGGLSLYVPDLRLWSLFYVLSYVLGLSMVSALTSSAWDLHRRRLASLLRDGRDDTERELRELRRLGTRDAGAFYAYLAVALQWATLQPRALFALRDDAGPDALAPTPLGLQVQADARDGHPGLLRALRAVGWVSGDNLLAFLSVVVLVGAMPAAMPWVAVLALVLVTYGITVHHQYLADAARRAGAVTEGTTWASTRP